jgi:hypothetical protein
MKESEKDEIIIGLLVRVSSLENLLISSGVLKKEQYTDEMAKKVNEIRESITNLNKNEN